VLEVKKLIDAEDYLLQISLVIFDLDDTLYSEKDYVRSGYKEIACHFVEIDDMANKLWNAFKNGEKAINYVLKQERLLSPKNIEFCLNIYRNHQPKISLYPDAEKLLSRLKNEGIHLGLITDGRPEGQRAKIKALGIEHYFEKIIITDELGGIDFRKPNTKAFEEMQQFFGVPYDEMIYVGDNPQKDFIAPQKLGMNFIFFNNQQGLYSNKGV
jgi:putative hydrolase of the HAD superfamily